MKQETIKMEEMRKQPSRLEVIGYFIDMGMVGFCFGIGLMLAVKTVKQEVVRAEVSSPGGDTHKNFSCNDFYFSFVGPDRLQ